MTRRQSSLPVRPVLLALAVAALTLVGAVGIVAAHGNHATATPQVSANGSVVVEEVFLTDGAYLVLRADDGGDPGRVLGYRALDRGRHTGVRVAFDGAAWADASGNTTVWAVLHADDGDGEFDPDTDTMLLWFGDPAGDRLAVRKGDDPVNVVTPTIGGADGGVPVTETTLGQPGFLVAHAIENGTLGPPLGSLSLAAGHHTDVTVPLDRTPNGSVLVAVHTDDGDGEFAPGDDPAVRVAGDPVASRYDPTTRRSIGITTPTPGSTAEPTDTAGHGFGVVVTVLAVLVVAVVARR